MKIYDISQEVFSCAVYPGDPSPERQILCSTASGHPYNLCAYEWIHWITVRRMACWRMRRSSFWRIWVMNWRKNEEVGDEVTTSSFCVIKSVINSNYLWCSTQYLFLRYRLYRCRISSFDRIENISPSSFNANRPFSRALICEYSWIAVANTINHGRGSTSGLTTPREMNSRTELRYAASSSPRERAMRLVMRTVSALDALTEGSHLASRLTSSPIRIGFFHSFRRLVEQDI